MDGIVSSNEEWEEYDYGNPPNTTIDSFLKPYLKAQEINDIEKEGERSQKKRKGNNSNLEINTLNKAPKSDNMKDEQPNKRVCKVEKFEAIKYSLVPSEEFIAIKSSEYNAWERNKDIITEYLVNISKRHALCSLNEDILKITILKTNTSYPSRKIRRIRAAFTKDHKGKKINTPYPEERLELGKNGSAFIQGEMPRKMKDPGLFILPCRLGDSNPFDTLADLGLADGTKSYPIGIVKHVEVHIGKLKLLEDFYVIDMEKDPTTPLLIGRGFLATASVVLDCRKTKIAVGEGITRLIFEVKEIDLGGEEVSYWTTLGFMDYHMPEEWEIARDTKLKPFKDVLVFRKMVERQLALDEEEAREVFVEVNATKEKERLEMEQNGRIYQDWDDVQWNDFRNDPDITTPLKFPTINELEATDEAHDVYFNNMDSITSAAQTAIIHVISADNVSNNEQPRIHLTPKDPDTSSQSSRVVLNLRPRSERIAKKRKLADGIADKPFTL
ncbi:MAK10-like protein [Tanacetum coccineum]|uniref:MAK10-like protein n=1 Tax=Tanacetum coccineum TaxID=301880 RepID=A0ABQ5ABW0_9ASTR